MSRYEGLLAETVTISGYNGDDVEAYFARPLGPGPFPGVIHVHHMPGWDADSKAFARQFAANGYATICINNYAREAPTASSDDAAAIVRANGGLDDTQAVGDFEGAAKYLRMLPNSNGKVGIIGWCSGGRHTVLAACSFKVEAAVDCWGGRVVAKPEEMTEKNPMIGVNMIGNLSAPMLGLFGVEDQNPSPEAVEVLREALVREGKEHEFHSFEGAGHGFMAWSRPSYRVEQTNEAWKLIMEFFGKHLSS